jgi:hypothetical protein
MKIHDFGLWFRHCGGKDWSTTIPQKYGPQGTFEIFYDGRALGIYDERSLYIHVFQPHKIHLKSKFSKGADHWFKIGRRLTLDDFEIIPNPDYPGDQ